MMTEQFPQEMVANVLGGEVGGWTPCPPCLSGQQPLPGAGAAPSASPTSLHCVLTGPGRWWEDVTASSHRRRDRSLGKNQS